MTQSKPPWFLQQINLFQGLPPEKINEIEACFYMKTYQKGETVMNPDSQPKVYIVEQGKIDLYNLSLDGKKVIIETLKAGSIFGRWENIAETGYYAEARTEAKICSLEKETYFLMLAKYPDIAATMIQHLMARLNFAHQRISSLANDNAFKKLARLFLQLGKVHGQENNQKIIIKEKFTHEQLSQMLGISRQTVTSLINCMKKQNLITKQNKHFTFTQSDLENV